MTRAFIVTPVYNARRYIKASVLSVADQLPAYHNLTHIIVDDCSNDGTWERLLEDDLTSPHSYMLRHGTNGASAVGSFMTGIDFIRQNCNPDPDDVVFWVDGDDWLCDDLAIAKMMRAYRNSAVEMAYSDHLVWTGGLMTKPSGYSHPMIDRTRVRYGRVCYSHLRSFKWKMLDHVSPDRLRDPEDGAYWKFAGDSALFLPMLEVATRVKYVKEPLYVYNEEREDNEAKKDAWEQSRCSVTIRSQPPATNNRPDAWPGTEFAPAQRFKVDHGRACNLSCSFCYYLHQKPWRNKPLEEIESQIRAGAERGNRMCDISGGEPSLAKDLPEWLALCAKYHIQPGIITHGQDIEHKLEGLWDAGLSDILFSIHGTRDYHNKVTGTEKRDGYARLWRSLEKCTESGFKFRTNTVLTENFTTLPALANELVKVKPYISNFINFNPYNEWNCEDKPFQAKVSDIAPYLMTAIDTLVESGTMVNVRYFPLCVLKDYERHVVHYPQVMFDPYEWDYGHTPKTPESYAARGEKFVDEMCVYTSKCHECSAVGGACPGLNRIYYETFGEGELEPYTERIDGAFHWRKNAEQGQLYNYVGANAGWLQRRAKGN